MPRNRIPNTGVASVAAGGKAAARDVARSELVEWIMRLGYFVRGLVYGLVGLLAIQVALGGHGGKITDQQGVIAYISQLPYGRFLLIVILVGLGGYAIWGVIRAWLDPLNKGSDAKGIIARIGYLISAASYTALMVPTLRAIQRKPGAAQAGGTTASAQRTLGSLLSKPYGPFLVGAIGLGILVAGIIQIATGLRANFDMRFDTYKMTAYEHKWATRLGRIGYVARGIVFAIIGIFVVQAARMGDAARARGFDGALAALSRQPYGWLLLAIVAAGLIAFGIYSILGAFWFRFKRV
jgi:hypothetical protein